MAKIRLCRNLVLTHTNYLAKIRLYRELDEKRADDELYQTGHRK